MSQCESNGAAVVDRIPAQYVTSLNEAQGQPQIPFGGTSAGTQNFTSSGTFVPLLPPDDIATPHTEDAPALAVGPDPSAPSDPTRASVYVFDGFTGGHILAWHGTADNSIAYQNLGVPPWTYADNTNDRLERAVVRPDGTLYALSGYTLYYLASPWQAGGPTGMTFVGTIPTDGIPQALEPLVTVQSVDSTLAVNPRTGMIYAAWQEGWALHPALGRIMVSQIDPTSISPAWSVPVQVDLSPGQQLRPALAVDPVSGQASVLYLTTAANGPEDTTAPSLWPRMATPSAANPGQWVHTDLTSNPLTSLTDATGPDFARYTGLALVNGVGTAVWSGLDPTQSGSFATGVNPYLAEARSVSIAATGEVLVVTNDGTSAGQQIVISGDATGAPVVSIDGTPQTYTASGPIVEVIVNAINGAALTVDRTSAAIDVPGGIQFQSIDASAVTLVLHGVGSFLATGSSITTKDLAVSFGSIASATIQLDDANDDADFITPTGAPVVVVAAGAGLSNVTANVDPASVGAITLQGSFDTLTLNGATADDSIGASYHQVDFDQITIGYDSLVGLILNADGGTNHLTLDFTGGAAIPTGDPFFNDGEGLRFSNTGLTSTLKVICGAGNDAVDLVSTELSVSTLGGLYQTVFTGVGTIQLDPGAGADAVTIGSGSAGHPVSTVEYTTGDGTDTLDCLATNFAPQIVFDGGSGHFAAVSIAGGATLKIAGHAANAYNTLVTGTLSIESGGTLDITNCSMIVGDNSEGQLAEIEAWLVSGYRAIIDQNGHLVQDGDWGGTGIVSSLATPGQQYATTIGYGLESSLGLAQFGGQTPTAYAVLVRYTYVGDVDLNGTANNADISRIIAKGKYESGLPAVWTDGNINYDLFADSADISSLVASGNYLDGLSLGD